jgi:hypothetical protein
MTHLPTQPSPSARQPILCSPLFSALRALVFSAVVCVTLTTHSSSLMAQEQGDNTANGAQDSTQEGSIKARVQKSIEEGQAALKRSQSRSVRRSRVKKLSALKEALRSFSVAHRSITVMRDLQQDPQELSDELDKGFLDVLSDPLVQKELNDIESALMKALVNKDYNKAGELAQQLSELNARSREYLYLIRLFNSAQP